MTNQDAVRALYGTVMTQKQYSALADLTAPEYPGGAAGFEAALKPLLTALPDVAYTLDHVIEDRDGRIAVRFRYTGTHQGPFRDVAPTGKTISGTGIAIHTFRDGRIASTILETDRLGFLVQLGIVPATALPPGPPPGGAQGAIAVGSSVTTRA